MTGIAPVSVTISERAPVLIVDARLALSQGGLLLAVRLARHAQVWLPCMFWDLIDRAELMPPAEDPRAQEEALLWKSAWYSGALQGSFYWVGEARREGVLPDGMDSWLPPRHEWLDSGLNPAEPATEAGALPTGGLAVCSRQSMALAVALAAFTPVVLTAGVATAYRRSARGRSTRTSLPELCLESGLPPDATAKVKLARDIATLSQPLRSGRIESALTQMRLKLTDRALVGAHVVAPLAVDFALDYEPGTPREDEPDQVAAQRHASRLASRVWAGASVLWHEIG